MSQYAVSSTTQTTRHSHVGGLNEQSQRNIWRGSGAWGLVE